MDSLTRDVTNGKVKASLECRVSHKSTRSFHVGPDGAAAACIPRFIAIVIRPVSRVRTKLPSALVLDTSRHPLDTLVSATPSRGKLR